MSSIHAIEWERGEALLVSPRLLCRYCPRLAGIFNSLSLLGCVEINNNGMLHLFDYNKPVSMPSSASVVIVDRILMLKVSLLNEKTDPSLFPLQPGLKFGGIGFEKGQDFWA